MSYKDKEKQKQWFKERKAKRLENGLCRECGRVRSGSSKTRCVSCLDKNAEYMSVKTKQWKENGMCIKCGGFRDGEALTCCSCKEFNTRHKELSRSMEEI